MLIIRNSECVCQGSEAGYANVAFADEGGEDHVRDDEKRGIHGEQKNINGGAHSNKNALDSIEHVASAM